MAAFGADTFGSFGESRDNVNLPAIRFKGANGLPAFWENLSDFNPTTKKLKVQRPAGETPRQPAKEPSVFPHALTNKGVGVSPAYRYFYEGKEYSPDEAGKLVKQQGTQGWRWEPR